MNRIQAPLHALRAFEAVARLGSVKDASLELGVIPSAVSHQVRKLEQFLGSRLFDRRGHRMLLSEEGHRLLPGVSIGFETISEAMAEHHRDRFLGPLRLSVLETFASYWLIPRLGQYPLRDESRAIRLMTSQRLVAFDTENVDAAIRLGARSTELEGDPLFDETLSLFAAADLAQDAPVFLSRHRHQEWESFVQRVGRPRPNLVIVDSSSLAIKAALDAVGFGFAPVEIADSEVRAGRLVQVAADTVPSSRDGYWLVYPRLSRRDRRLRAFRDWLLEQADQKRGKDE